jgi:hypothetical protein
VDEVTKRKIPSPYSEWRSGRQDRSLVTILTVLFHVVETPTWNGKLFRETFSSKRA